MLSFDSSLTTALTKSATVGYWLLRLYYNDESSYTGISDRTRTIGGVIYYGLATFGAGHNQTLKIDQFTTSNGTMQVSLSNAPNKIDGKRFSDLFADNNYSNRKWELFQCNENADFSTDNLIAGGIISSDIKPTPTQITMYLNDYWAKYNIELPLNRATKALYPKVPEKNIDAPIPIWYGDFDIVSDAPAASDFQRHFVKGRVPAIVIDEGDSNGNVQSLPDTNKDSDIILNQLNAKNVFMYSSGKYISCDEGNVTIDANPADETENIILFSGLDWYGLYPFVELTDTDTTVTNDDNLLDGDLSTIANWAVLAGNSATITLTLPNNLPHHSPDTEAGERLDFLAVFGTFTDVDGVFDFAVNTFLDGADVQSFVWDGGAYQSKTSANNGNLIGEATVVMELDLNGKGNADVDIKQLVIQAKVAPDKTFTQTFLEYKRTGNTVGQYGYVSYERKREIVDALDSVFVSGKGREYGSWITSRSLPYTTGNLNENPIFQIEDVFRNELGIGSMVNTTSFNSAGDEDGDLENGFGENSVEDIKFAFSQHKLILAKQLIENICRQCGSYVWWAGDEVKIKARRRTYTSANQTINFKDVKIIDFGLTSMDNVFNYITVDYAYDYGANKTVKSRTPDDNGNLEDDGANSSQSSDVEGYNQVLKLPVDMPFTVDSTTADNYGEALLAWFKDRKQVITFQGKKGTARYNNAEVGDIINFSNWDSNLKIFGDTITTADGFMITQITKMPDSPKITVTEVAGTIS